ncbi:MAG: lipopolysaccharide heptosyltransferase I [Siculibacillus sp.]
MRVLLVKTSSMGDVVHVMPAITDALAARPGLSFDWLVEEGFVDVARLHPGVARVIPVATRRWRKAPLAAATRGEIAALKADLRRADYDLVLDAQGLVKSAMLARLPGRPIAGYDGASIREGLATFFYHRRHRVAWAAHAIDRNRLLFGAVFGYRPDLDRVDYGLAVPGGGGRSVMLLHGTSWPSKRWATGAWIDLARALADRGYAPMLTFASDEEEAVARAVAAGEPRTVVIPKARLAVIAEAIGAAAAVVGTDTGLTHLAVAYDRPTVAVFLSTAPDLTGPKGARVEVLTATRDCAPCRRKVCALVAAGEDAPCGATISVEAVVARLDALAATAGR